jgi:hypothetical protein
MKIEICFYVSVLVLTETEALNAAHSSDYGFEILSIHRLIYSHVGVVYSSMCADETSLCGSIRDTQELHPIFCTRLASPEQKESNRWKEY